MAYQKLFCYLGLSAIAILGSGLPAFSEETENARPPFEVGLVPPAPAKSTAPVTPPTTGNDCGLKTKQNIENRSQRVELFYYRNAKNIVNLLGQIPLEEGCAINLPLNSFQAGQGVGRGGGNILSLYGTQEYIDDAQRFIASLDLPLPGINLQLWGVQISSKDSEKLAKTTSKVRWRISETQRLLRDTLALIQGISQVTLQNLDPNFEVDTEFTDSRFA